MLRIWWAFLYSYSLQRHLEMIFHIHPILPHDADLGRRRLFSPGKNRLGAGKCPVRNSQAFCLTFVLCPSFLWQVCAGKRWNPLSVEPEEVAWVKVDFLNNFGQVSNLSNPPVLVGLSGGNCSCHLISCEDQMKWYMWKHDTLWPLNN